MVSVVGPGIGVLDGVDVLQGNGFREVSGSSVPVNLNSALFSRNVLDSCEIMFVPSVL